jgi:hypothetical protein
MKGNEMSRPCMINVRKAHRILVTKSSKGTDYFVHIHTNWGIKVVPKGLLCEMVPTGSAPASVADSCEQLVL